MFWKTQAYKELEAEWYQLLEDTGFEDIEINDKLKQNATNSYRQASGVEIHAKQEYHLQLSEYIYKHAPTFDDSIDYFVMHKFSIGCKNSEIVEELEKLGKPRHRKTIMYIRRKYEAKWGIIPWKPEELSSNQVPKQRSG